MDQRADTAPAPRSPGSLRRAAPAPPADLPRTAAVSVFLFVYLLAVFTPGALQLGPLLLTPYKLILIIATVPLGLWLLQGTVGRITLPDILFLLFCLWVSLSVFVVHGTSQIFYIGSTFLEYTGAYLVGRVLIRNASDYVAFFRYLIYVLLIMLPFALIEALTRRRLLVEIAGYVLSTGDYRVTNRPRMGITRVAGGFGHPILWGVVCSMAVANVYYIYKGKFLRRTQATAFVVFMTLLSVSNAPIFSILLQFVMIAWERIMGVLRSRWILFALIGLVTLVTLQLTLPGGIIGYIINEVLFNPYGGRTRLHIFEHGIANVVRAPLFGSGLNTWIRPWWLAGSVDNFWLLLAMRHGVPAFAFIVLAMGMLVLGIMTREGLDEAEQRCRAGYLIALAGLALALATVHIWAGATAFVMTYLGAGVWLYDGGRREAGPVRAYRPRRPRGEIRPRQPLGGQPGGQLGSRPARGQPAGGAAAGRERPGAATAPARRRNLRRVQRGFPPGRRDPPGGRTG